MTYTIIMKNIILKALLLYLFTHLFISCKKDNSGSTFDPTKKLYAYKATQKSTVRLFTNGVEIKNSAVINNFIKNSTVFNLDLSKIDRSYFLTFSSVDTAIFNNDNFNFPEKYSIVKQNNQFLFYSPEVLIDRNQTFRYLYDMFKYTYPQTPLPLSSGFVFKTKFIKVGYGSFKEVELSLLSYKYVQSFMGSRLSTEQSGLNNEFNENVISKLSVNDTLAIQEFSLRYNY